MRALRDAINGERGVVFVAVLCGFLTFALFGRSLFFGFAPVDDGELIIGNLAVHGEWTRALQISFTTFDPELYIPFTLLSYRITQAVSDSAVAFHLVNLLLHLCNAILVFTLVSRLTNKRLWSALAAALFTLHPVNVETVVWLSARKDLLMTFFGLLSLNVLARSRDARGESGALLLFLCSLLSKPSALLLPAAMPAFEKRRPTILAGFAVVSVCIAAVAILGKERLVSEISPVASFLILTKGVTLTLGKILFLVQERLSYDEHATIAFTSWSYALSILVCSFLCIAIAVTRKRRPLASAGLLLFIALLVTPLFNARAGSTLLAPDRYAYFPFIGLLIAGVSSIPQAWEDLRGRAAKIAAGTGVLACAVAVSLSVPVVSSWSSAQALYGRVLEIDPASSPSRVALARLRLAGGDIEGAFALLRDGLKYGDDEFLHIGAAEVYAAAGQPDDAIDQLKQAETFDAGSADPVYAEALIFLQTDRTEQAVERLRRAIELEPTFAEARVALAAILLERNQLGDAETQLREALRLRHSSTDAHVLLARLLRATGRPQEAEQHEKDARALGAEP